MTKELEAIKIRQELIEEVEKEVARSNILSLSEFVSDAIRLRLQELAKGRVSEYLERDRKTRARTRFKTELFYTPRHIWAQITSKRTIRIGVTDYFQRQLKSIVDVHTNDSGDRVSRNESFGVVENWWFVYDIYSPLNGKIISVNKKVIDNPLTLNTDAYQWILEVEPTEVNSWMNGLLNPEGYEELIARLEGIPERRLAAKSQESSFTREDEKKGEHLPKLKKVTVGKHLLAAAESALLKNHYHDLSEFVTEAVQLRLDELKQSHQTIVKKESEYPMIHERLLYTSDHMWTTVTPEGSVRVGLSYYAQTRLKGIASIQIDPIGHEVKKEEPFGVVETWMFMFDLYSPISGRIIDVNRVLQEKPFTINEDPYDIFWIAEIKPNNLIVLEEELRDLMNPDQYKTWVNKLGPPRILGP